MKRVREAVVMLCAVALSFFSFIPDFAVGLRSEPIVKKCVSYLYAYNN